MGEILSFPKKEGFNNPMTSSELSDKIEEFRVGYVDDVSEFILAVVISEIGRAGFDLVEEDDNDVMLICESVRSLMLRKQGIEHNLQNIADDLENIVIQ